MWKWSDHYNIKAIIIDCDSLDQNIINYNYNLILENVYIFKVKSVLTHDININNIIEYYDYYDLIRNVLETVQCSTYSVIAISSHPEFIKNMMQYHVGTIFADEVQSEFLQNVPDHTFQTELRLQKILENVHIGYAAEVYASQLNGKKSLLMSKTKIELDNGETKNINLCFGGRYYPQTHKYF